MIRQGLRAVVLAGTTALATTAYADPPVLNVTRSFAETVVWQIHGTSTRIGRMLMDARTRHDDARTACANDALTRANAAYRRAMLDAKDAKSADTRGDAEGVKRAVARLNVDRDAAGKASSDVDTCFAIERAADNQTVVHVVVDSSVAP